MRKTITKSIARSVTRDWIGAFPGMVEYSPLRLLRRVGPIVQGVVLERTSGNDRYRPTFHVHSLLREFPVVTMTMACPLRSEESGVVEFVEVSTHATRFSAAAARLAKQAPLSTSGDLVLSDVLSAYRAYAQRPGIHFDHDLLYEDMACICAWSGESAQVVDILSEGMSMLAGWPPDNIELIGGRDVWFSRVAGAVADRGRLVDIVHRQITALGLSDVPVSRLLVD